MPRIQVAEYSDREMSLWYLEDNCDRYNLTFKKDVRTWTLERLDGDDAKIIGIYDKAPSDILKRCNIGKLIG